MTSGSSLKGKNGINTVEAMPGTSTVAGRDKEVRDRLIDSLVKENRNLLAASEAIREQDAADRAKSKRWDSMLIRCRITFSLLIATGTPDSLCRDWCKIMSGIEERTKCFTSDLLQWMNRM